MKNYKLLSSSIKLGDWMSPEQTARHYNAAKMVINLHRPADDETNRNTYNVPACSVNPRTFEINGCATLQLVDARAEIASMYTPDKEIVVYGSPEELLYKVHHYAAHEEERREIALQGLPANAGAAYLYDQAAPASGAVFPAVPAVVKLK